MIGTFFAFALLWACLSSAAVGLAWIAWQVRTHHLDCWLVPFVAQSLRRRLGRREDSASDVHLILCIADHFEPEAENVSAEQARRRVRRWVRGYPRCLGSFRDSDGYTPRHTFFYPIEAYVPEDLDALAALCRRGHGEVEIHLHHDGDTAENLRATLEAAREVLADRHGLLARDRVTGAATYAFVHGNWALDNARPDGRYCGVNNELDVLRETGCYADLTLPSAPSPTQTRTINQLYYACDDPARPKSHDRGVAVGTGAAPARSLMLIQGPLLLDWGRRKWGLVPRIENGCIQESQPARIDRLPLWLRAQIQIPSRPDWYFVKLHAHGATESGRRALMGRSMVEFHQALSRRAADDPRFHYHYVTAREMYNLVRAAEAGWSGSIAEARDYELTWGGGRPAASGCSQWPDRPEEAALR